MKGFNQVTIAGNVGRSPELNDKGKVTTLKFSVGVNDSFDEDHVEWFNVVIFGKFAETMERFIEKGTPVLVSGRLKTHQYEKDGEKKYFTELICDQLNLLGDGGGRRDGRDDREDRGRGRDRDDDRRDRDRGRDRDDDRRGHKSRDEDSGENPFRR